MNKVISRVFILLLTLVLVSKTLGPSIAFAHTNQAVHEEAILYQVNEDIVIEEGLTINKGTLFYGQEADEESLIYIQFGESYLPLFSQSVSKSDINDNEAPLFFETVQLEDAKNQTLSKGQVFYGLYPDEKVRVQLTEDIEYPVYQDKMGLEIVYIGNVEFYLSAEDRQIAKEYFEYVESEESCDAKEKVENEDLEEEFQEEDLAKEIEEPIVTEEKETLKKSIGDFTSKPEEKPSTKKETNSNTTNSLTSTDKSKVASKNIDFSAGYFKTNIDNLPVYSKGNTKILGTLTKGQTYPIDSDYGNWHRIQFGNTKGYVYKANTVPDNGAILKNKNTKYNHSKQNFVALQDVVVYDNSSGQLVEFGKIKSGERYPIVSEYGKNWSRVIFGDRVGYVLNSQVRHEFMGGEKYFTVLVSNLPIYDNRSGSLKQVGTLTKGQSYEIVSDYGNWHRIQYNNHYGYVYKASTEPSDGVYIRNKNKGNKHGNSRFKALHNLIVYDNTGGQLKAFGTIEAGQTYFITSDYGNWWKILFADRVGYVHKSGVELLVTKIFLDPGHGGHDPGGIGYGLREKDVVLDIGLKTADYLSSNYYDVEVKLSRTTDKFVTLGDRSVLANEWDADYFVSLHTNAHNGSTNGFESFIYNGSVSQETKDRQKDIHGYLMKKMNVYDRGMKQADFSVLRNSAMPAILLEYLFIDNYANNRLLSSASYRSTLAKITAEAIANSYGLTVK